MEFTHQFNKSYFVRIGINGDRNRSYFTYYSEFKRSSPGIVYAEIFFLCLLTVLSTVGNALIVYVVFSNKKMRTITNLFIANMCIADILFTLPNPVIGIVRYQESWKLGDWSCGFLIYNEIVCGVVLIWSMTLISMDRHRCIVKKWYGKLTGFIAKIAIGIAWGVALSLSIPIIIYFNVEEFDYGTETVRVCTLMWPKGALFRVSCVFVVIICIVGFVAPLIIIMCNYISIFKTLWSTRKIIMRQLSTQVPNKSNMANGKRKTQCASSSRNHRDFRVVKMLVSTVAIFGLMWLPMCIVFIMILYDGFTEAMSTRSWVFLLACCISFANACVNPIIYGMFNEKFRQGIKRAFCKFTPQRTAGMDSSKRSIQSISALAEMDKNSTPSTSSGQWRGSCSSITDTIKDIETKLHD